MIQRSVSRGSAWGLVFLAFSALGCQDLTGTGGKDEFILLSSDPAAGAQGVSVHSVVEIRFSSELDETTLPDAISLMDGERSILAWVYLKNGTILLLRPTEPLDFGTLYEVRVAPGIRNKAGKLLSNRRSWEFTTEGSPPPILVLDSLRLTLEALAHDSMRGRGSGTEDELRAADFIQERLTSYGLLPLQVGLLQPFEVFSQRLNRNVQSQNVLAAIPGTGSLAEEWVVVGAHYDHIGIRAQADGSLGLNNGADDNASGTALVLEMARVFQAYQESGGMPVDERRSVLFAAWGAEELGLLGSCYYARENPIVPLAHTHALMNFDMVGRLRNGLLTVRGSETSDSWSSMVRNANDPGLVLFDLTSNQGNSDFACFLQKKIPYLYFHTGIHAQYHTPADDVDLINFPGLVELGQVALRVLIRLAVMEGHLN